MRLAAACSTLLLLVLSLATPAEAQAEYFVDGERVGGVGGFVQRQDAAIGASVQAGVMVSKRVALSVSGGQTRVDDPYEGDLYVSTFTAGATVYAGRQNIDGPLTVAASFGIGRVAVDDDAYATPISAGFGIGRDLMPSGSPVAVVPSLQAALLLLLGDAATSSATLGAGLGLGLRMSPAVVFAFEPGLSLDLGPGDSEFAFIGGMSLTLAY